MPSKQIIGHVKFAPNEYKMKTIVLDKDIYSLDALFRAITDLRLNNIIAITKNEKSYILQFEDEFLFDEEKIIYEINTQMVRIQLEDKFCCIRNAIVKKALSVNKGIIDD